MPKSPKEAILIVLDVGANVGKPHLTENDTFLGEARQCITKIVQKKILSGSKDELGLILLGSEETNNPLEDGVSYGNIEIVHTFRIANWNMVHTLSKFKKCTTIEGDWLDALIVAVDYMKNATAGKEFNEKKIVLLSNFCSSVSDDEIDVVIQGLISEEVQVIAIGLDTNAGSSDAISSQDITRKYHCESEKLIRDLCDKVPNSVACSFDQALPQLSYFELKKTRPTPWKVIMDIGSIKIPIVGYKKVAEINKLKTHDIIISSQQKAPTALNQDPTQHALLEAEDQSDTGFQPHNQGTCDEDDFQAEEPEVHDFDLVDRDRAFQTIGDDASRVDISEVIEAYMFGTTVVPVTDDDKPQLVYKSGPRCLSVMGFTRRQNVPLHLLKGEGCYKIFAEKLQSCLRAFSALIQAMDSKDVVAIARKVYNNNNCPVICALFPMIKPTFQCFVLIELPYSEDVMSLLFPPLVTENNKPTKEQLNAVDDLITSMDLMGMDEYVQEVVLCEDDEEDRVRGAYDPRNTLDPYEQHFNSIVANRALNGDVYICAVEVSDTVKELLAPKEEVVMAAKPALDQIKRLYLLTEVTPKEGARKAAVDLFKEDVKPDISTITTGPLLLSNAKAVTPHIGTVQPQIDFSNLLEQCVPLDKACSLLSQVVIDMISVAFDEDDFGKPYKCLVIMRKECADKSPTIYNELLMKLKKDIPPEKAGFWKFIENGGSGLITSSESIMSKVSEEEAKIFLQSHEAMDTTVPAPQIEEDIDDLINQM